MKLINKIFRYYFDCDDMSLIEFIIGALMATVIVTLVIAYIFIWY